jgi:SpoVK/Ycf46/Vps4 family AAA+-type ATPase
MKKEKHRDEGFKNNLDYLSEYFNLIYRKACIYALSNMDTILKSSLSRYTDEAKSFYLELGVKNSREIPEKLKKMICEYRSDNKLFLKKIENSRTPLYLENIAKTHDLCKFEKDVIALAMALVTDSKLENLAVKLGFDSRSKTWEVKDYLNILTDSFAERVQCRHYFMATGKLFVNGLVSTGYSRIRGGDTENDFIEQTIQLPRRISSAIYGEDSPEDMILAFSEIITPVISLNQVVLNDESKKEVSNLIKKRDLFLKRRLQWGLEDVLSYGMGTILLFSGLPGTGKTMLAHALAKHANLKLLQVNVPNLLESNGAFEECFRMLLREATLQNAILFFDEADELFGDRFINHHMPTILKEFERFDGIAILATNRKQILDEALDRRILYKLDFDIPGPANRELIWKEHLPPKMPLDKSVNPAELAERFEFSGGYIKNAVLLASQKAIARTGKNAKIFQDDLVWAARIQRNSQLERFADKVTPKVKLNTVILPPKLKNKITRIISEYRNSSTVYEKWNFKETIHYGRAITAMMYGEPGVGKTMAAEAIAHELGLNLYPVKISSIVSKYVGETAKNLKRVFDAAKEAEALLLFDEADALFSSRIEGGGHHAVYINQEVDVLLQEMEKFRGIVLLTTNMPDRIDQAFMRRIRHHLKFQFPSAAAREKIWEKHFPENAPLSENINFAKLAEKYEVSGGIIRNIAIKSAFEAACTKDGQITMDILENLLNDEEKLKNNKKTKIGFGHVA